MSEPRMNSVPVPDSRIDGVESDRSAAVAWALGLFLGVLGVDRFYLGKHQTGALKLLTGGGFGIWWLIDLISYIRGTALDVQKRPLSNFPSSPRGMIVISSLAFTPVLLFVTWIILNAEPIP